MTATLTAPIGDWAASVTWITLTDTQGDYRECATCGEPEGEACVWCGCACTPERDRAEARCHQAGRICVTITGWDPHDHNGTDWDAVHADQLEARPADEEQ